MKKFMMSMAVVAALGFTAVSCGSDDDGGDGDDGCQTCTVESVSAQYCDKGDGTMDVTVSGQTINQDLNGVTFAQFIAALEQAGGTCN